MQPTEQTSTPVTAPWHILRGLDGNSDEEVLLALTDCDEPDSGVGGGSPPVSGSCVASSWLHPHCA